MTMRTTVLQPGILVSLKTSLKGGVVYQRVDLEVEDATVVEVDGETVADKSRWETTKIVDDPAELARATKIRSTARGRISAVCAPTSFGLICAAAREAELNKAVAEAQEMIEDFNSGAIATKVELFVLKGRIAASDEEAAKAIASDVKDLLEQMEQGIRKLDVETIRDAASRARKLGAVLDPTQSERLGKAVAAARTAAREITKRVTKGGELAEKVLAELDTAPIQTARFAFLDLDTAPAAEGEASQEMPAVNLQRVAELDLGDEFPEQEIAVRDEPSEAVTVSFADGTTAQATRAELNAEVAEIRRVAEKGRAIIRRLEDEELEDPAFGADGTPQQDEPESKASAAGGYVRDLELV